MKVELRHGDFRTAEIEPVDLILTDPPYGAKYMYLWDALGILGKQSLKPGGWLIAYAGQAHLDEEILEVSKWLPYYWTFSLQLVQKQQVYKIRVMWKPILVFYKPPKSKHEFIVDVLQGAGKDKRFHKWGQNASELKTIINAFSKEGDTVLDPMAGGGATVQACIESGRNLIAYEIDSNTFNTLKERVAQVVQ
ncbi:MAG: DNA methyltransferase [Candidatus Micrarchaeaceae archaeon]